MICLYALNEHIIKSDDIIPIKAHINDSDIDTICADSHFHAEIEFVYIIEGALSFSAEGEEFIATDGQLIIFNEMTEHSSRTKGRVRICLLQFRLDMMRKIFPRRSTVLDDFFAQNFKYLILDTKNIAEFTELPALMFSTAEELNKKAPAYEFSVVSSILKMLTIIFRAKQLYPFDGKSELRLTPASNDIIQYIANNYIHEIRIEDVAKHFHFSASNFSRIFKKMTGTSFVKYLNTYRIGISKKLLMNPKNSITYAMMQVGITNRSYYNRLFKRTTGLTPQEFRNKFFNTQNGINKSKHI